MSDDSGLVNYATSLNEDPSTLRIFRRSGQLSSYLVVGTHAEMIAKDFLRTTSALKNAAKDPAGDPIWTVSFNESVMKDVVVDILSQGNLGLELHQDKKVVKRATAGNTQDFEEYLFAANATVMTLRIGARNGQSAQVSIACCYISTALRTIGHCTFMDSAANFQNLKAFIVTSSAKECIVEKASASVLIPAEKKLLEDTCTRHAVKLVWLESPTRSWDAAVAEASLRKLIMVFRQSSMNLLIQEGGAALSVTGGCIDYVGLLLDECNLGQYRLVAVAVGTFMKIDAATVQALHLEKLCDALKQHCMTNMGQRLLRFYIAQPLTNVEEIARRQDMTGVFIEDAILREGIRIEALAKSPDMDKLLKRLQRRKATLQDTVVLSGFLERCGRLRDLLSRYVGEQKDMVYNELLVPLNELCGHFENLRTLISNVIEVLDQENGGEARIAPDFDEALQNLDVEKNAVVKKINVEFRRVLGAYKWNEKQLKMECSGTQYTLRVSRKDDKEARSGKDFTVLQTTKDGVRFVTGEMSKLNEMHRRICEEYNSRQQELQDKFLDTIATYAPALDDAVDLVAQVDVFSAWAVTVTRSRSSYVRPVFTAEGRSMLLKGMRHALLQDQGEMISNDAEFNHEAAELYLITGPNMGGKSTYMRSVALTAILAQMGCYVPCEYAECCVFDSVLCRVGAGDLMAHGVSTFMREMQETAHILSCATDRSLVIIDELGRGTSTYDGFGIAWAVAEHLATVVHCFTLFATHFHEMTSMRLVTVRNIHVTANVEEGRLTFPYKMMPGACLKSFGIHVAEMAHFPKEALEAARLKAEELESLAGPTLLGEDGVPQDPQKAVPLDILTGYMEEYSRTRDKKRLRDAMERDSTTYPGLRDLLK